jgi:hypothetical protein
LPVPGLLYPELCGDLAISGVLGSVTRRTMVPLTPRPPHGRPQGPREGKTVVTLLKKPILSPFLSVPHPRRLRQPLFTSVLVTRRQPGDVRPGETPTPHELATSLLDRSFSLQLSPVWERQRCGSKNNTWKWGLPGKGALWGLCDFIEF